MRYICIDDGAVNELISGREYQSMDFQEGARLINALSGNVRFLMKQKKIVLFQDKEGAFLTTRGFWKSKKFVVIDCKQSELFSQLSLDQSLTSFQKLLRFCTKYWTNRTFNNSEKIIQGTSKAILFPLPYENDAPFRVAIERYPLRERLKKRQMDGHFLLVYKSGRHAGNSATETADETTFRRVYNSLSEVYDTVSNTVSRLDQTQDAEHLASTDLSDTPGVLKPIQIPLKKWFPNLTEYQSKFVFAPRDTPHRLQGPAGTGKTLSLMLRTVRILLEAERSGTDCHALLVTHSEATREAISEALLTIDDKNFQFRDRFEDTVSLSVHTLASLCAKFLATSISETEFVDRDAQDSKILQQLYVERAIEHARSSEFASFSPHLSSGFREFLQKEANERLSIIFQHEIAVLIKGRAGDSFEIYKKCPPLKYGLPIENSADKGFAFAVFQAYQRQLEDANQFDTDDVVISAVGQLDTPIWRRRRAREAFDFIAIDETHLFNINELQVFHHFTRGVERFPISFTIDRAQAVGDQGWNDMKSFDVLFGTRESELDSTNDTTTVNAIFRCSPNIAEFCYSILASGATLFTNFVNTMSPTQSAFTVEDERRSQRVKFFPYSDIDAMVVGAFQLAEQLRRQTKSSRSEVLVTTLSDELLNHIRDYAKESNKPATFLERRGDFRQVSLASKSGHLVIGHADFVGGLEFNAVVIVGVDKGRVPHEGESSTANSRSYATYAAHNRLYVAASRARYALYVLGERGRGPSELLKGATANGLIEIVS